MAKDKLRNQAIGNYAWMRVLERSDLPGQVKLVGFILAINANADGSTACVGEERLGDTAICDERYASDALDVLELLGLIEVTKHGRRAGDANVYQLTTPGGLLQEVPMRRDRDYKPINADGSPRTGKRPKPPATRPLLAMLQGKTPPPRPMPDIDRTGNPVPEPPVDNPGGTGTVVPLRLVPALEPTDEYQHSGATTAPVDNDPYRHSVAAVPATDCAGTGTPVPPTNYYQLLPTNSPQATNSPVPDGPACGQPDEATDPELEAAHAVLAILPPLAARAWRHAAQAELEADGAPLTKRAVAIHAAALATRPPPATAAAEGAA